MPPAIHWREEAEDITKLIFSIKKEAQAAICESSNVIRNAIKFPTKW